MAGAELTVVEAVAWAAGFVMLALGFLIGAQR